LNPSAGVRIATHWAEDSFTRFLIANRLGSLGARKNEDPKRASALGRPDRRGPAQCAKPDPRPAFLQHETAKAELKALMPEDAKEAIGHGIRAKRSKSGSVSLDVLAMEGGHAPVQC